MKKILLVLLVVVLTFIVILFSCKRDKDCDNCTVNAAPFARAGGDFITSLPNVNVVLDGTSSGDVDGKIVKWLWTKISGPAPHEIVTKDSAITFLRNVVEGNYQFQLEVTDNGGLSAKDTISLTVLSENHPPKAVAGADMSISLSHCAGRGAVNLDGSASTDPDNNISNYLWRKISGPFARLQAITTTRLKVDEMLVGTYAFELSVIDARGVIAKDTVNVEVTQPVPEPYEIDITTTGGYLFTDNYEYCYYYWYFPCDYGDIITWGAKVNLSLSEVFEVRFSDYSDSANTSYADYSHVSFYSEASNKNAVGQCSVNLKKLLQDGGGSFAGTLKITGGNVEQCVPNILTSLPPLTITGTMDTTAKKLTITIKGKLYF